MSAPTVAESRSSEHRAGTRTERGAMPLASHLREARNRGIRAAVALAIGIVVAYLLADIVLDALRAPLAEIAAERDASLNFDTLTGAFDLKVKLAVFGGIVLSSPVWLTEIFLFLAPGLTRTEKKWTFGFLGSALPIFLAGCATGWSIFPHMVVLLLGFSSQQDSTILIASTYVDFAGKLVLATGVAFVLPVFLVLLNFAGILSAHSIARGWRAALIAVVVFSALVTPAADVISMVLVAVPMYALFAAALVIALVHDHRLARRLTVTLESADGDGRDVPRRALWNTGTTMGEK